MSRECVELIGYGTDSQFYGWIVLNRINLMTSYKYGRQLNVLAQGYVTGTNTGASVTYKTFDSTTMSVTRLGEGRYRLFFSSTWLADATHCIVHLTGMGYSYESTSAPIKPTLVTRAQSYIEVETSDDASRNDGAFMFQIINLNDWM